MKNSLRISFLAPTGYGKTTAATFVANCFNAVIIKLAEPLYEIQRFYYNLLGKPETTQDGELLQYFGHKICKDAPNFLFETFQAKLNEIAVNNPKAIIVNDDCRPSNYEKLKRENFIFIKIEGIKYGRTDITPINPAHSLEWHDNIPCDYTISNRCSMVEFKDRTINIVEWLIKNECKYSK